MKLFLILLALFFATVGTYLGICIARADEIPTAVRIDPAKVEAVTAKVRAILYLEGHPAKSPLPFPAYSVELRDVAGLAIDGAAVVNSIRPADCFEADLAHEIAHLILGRDYGFGPRKSERIASIVDATITDNPYRPNCAGTQKVAEIRE